MGSWRWVFYINVPVAISVLIITSRHVPESKDPNSKGKVDKLGAASAVAFLASLTYGLLEASSRGWTSPVVLAGSLSWSSERSRTRCSR